MRATECCQGSAHFQQFKSAQMNLFVAAKSVWNRSAITGERGWIQNDKIPAWNGLFMRFFRGLFLQPIENIHRFERTFFSRTIQGGVAPGNRNSLFALVQHADMRSTCACCVQSKPTHKTEAIQDLCSGGELSYFLVIQLLIEV